MALHSLDMKRVPKVLLHEHLDGGLRPASVIELAKEVGYAGLPTADSDDLAAWFHRGAQRGNLVEYLEGFQHTIAVMQSRDGLERVAYEFIEDIAADGVVYAEVRFAPVYHTAGGLTQDEVMAAVTDGLRRGGEELGVRWGLIVCAMRDREDSLEAAGLAIRWRDKGAVGFDLAGGEEGFPPKRHIEAFQTIQRANFNNYHPRRGGVWARFDLAGAAMVRRAPARSRHEADGRHHGARQWRATAARRAGAVRARSPGAAGDLPAVERPHRRLREPGGASVPAVLRVGASAFASTPTTG